MATRTSSAAWWESWRNALKHKVGAVPRLLFSALSLSGAFHHVRHDVIFFNLWRGTAIPPQARPLPAPHRNSGLPRRSNFPSLALRAETTPPNMLTRTVSQCQAAHIQCPLGHVSLWCSIVVCSGLARGICTRSVPGVLVLFLLSNLWSTGCPSLRLPSTCSSHSPDTALGHARACCRCEDVS